jgi:glycosyltransferase involved in cell wall biosynthesis
MGKKILWVSDLDTKGSGYFYLSAPLCTHLSKMGYDVKAIGISYGGGEHDFPFSIIPAKDLQEAHAEIHNLVHLWKPDTAIVALDIPLQDSIKKNLAALPVKYIAITPLENGPLCMAWAAALMALDFVFFISELGKQEALKAGLTNVDHLQIGVDTVSWRVPTPEERSKLREAMGLDDDTFAVLTVADNQERKNLWAAVEAVGRLKKRLEGKKKVKYFMVTREHSPVGNKLRELAMKAGINQEFIVLERGLPSKELWTLYAMSDAFVLSSKAEGLGMIVLEAMACGVPCFTTNTGALTNLLSDNRGFLISPEYTMIDVWGNSRRDFINIEELADALYRAAMGKLQLEATTREARKYVEGRTWDFPAKQLHDKISELCDEQA